jgi:hypothetical protein
MATSAQRRITPQEIRRFGSGREPFSIPDLTQIQTRSYENFLQYDIPSNKRKDHGIESVLVEKVAFPRYHIGESMTAEAGVILRELGFEQEMIDAGLEAHLATVDLAKLPLSFAGRRLDNALLSALPEGADPCGENGEFHSFVNAGPMFTRPIRIAVGETVPSTIAITSLSSRNEKKIGSNLSISRRTPSSPACWSFSSPTS